MYAVIETGSKQYKVEKDQVIEIEKLDGEAGAKISFDKVLLVSSGDDKVAIGTPYVSGAKVMGSILLQGKADKVTTVRFKRKVNYHRTIGHRQQITRVKIEEVSYGA